MLDDLVMERPPTSITDKRIVVHAPTGRTVRATALFVAGSMLAGASGTTSVSPLDVSRLSGARSSLLVAFREQDDGESLADVMADVKRRSGLTWDELGRLLSVSRKTVHNWAAGAAIKDAHLGNVYNLLERVRSLGEMRPFQVRRLLLEEAKIEDRASVPPADGPAILFADQSPSNARLNVRRGGMKIVRRNGASG